jgi:DNA polymerase III epsilon subunit-like protein
MAQHEASEAYISIDIEAAGPIPGEYSMLSLGACLVEAPETTFYAEFRPVSDRYVPEALNVGGLSLERLREVGCDPAEAMASLRDWVDEVAGERRAVFVGFNASFDWAFVNWYFHVFLGTNPFGIGALDIKAYYMGLSGVTWAETSSSRLPKEFWPSRAQTHNALDDAIAQAEIFRKLLDATR